MQLDPAENRFYQLVQSKPTRPYALVLMPFKEEEFPRSIHEDVYVPVVRDVLGISCIRVDEDPRKSFLEPKIYTHLIYCSLVIAEIATENPNVILELGMALALSKEIIITCHKGYKSKDKRLAFDYAHYDTIFYDNEDDLKNQLVGALDALKGTFAT